VSNPINDIAAVIRQHPNNIDTDVLALAIAVSLDTDGASCTGCAGLVAEIIEQVNPDRQMGAGALAEVIWNELDDEN
jgi:hypothetical protein